MNYRDDMLENKSFDFFKQLLYNILVSICIMLAVSLVLVYCFGYKPYIVQSNSMSPVYHKDDVVVVKAYPNYKIGDILSYEKSAGGLTINVSHRLIGIKTDVTGREWLIMHGDAVQSIDGTPAHTDWSYDRRLVEEKSLSDLRENSLVDVISLDTVKGKVVASFKNYGVYANFIIEHKLLLVALVIGIWCLSATVQNELEMKKSRRLL